MPCLHRIPYFMIMSCSIFARLPPTTFRRQSHRSTVVHLRPEGKWGNDAGWHCGQHRRSPVPLSFGVPLSLRRPTSLLICEWTHLGAEHIGACSAEISNILRALSPSLWYAFPRRRSPRSHTRCELLWDCAQTRKKQPRRPAGSTIAPERGS